jgi:hypothetical protein
MIVRKEVGLIQLNVLAHELLMSKVYILTLTRYVAIYSANYLSNPHEILKTLVVLQQSQVQTRKMLSLQPAMDRPLQLKQS